MPIEREFKYVLRSPDELYQMLLAHREVKSLANIHQGYLSRGGRFRKRHWWNNGGPSLEDNSLDGGIEFLFTYKHDLTSQPGVLELEHKVSEDDFDLAWPDTTHRLQKDRFLLPSNTVRGVWEIDFFKDNMGLYLALAEFEVPAHAGPPDRLHPLVEEHLIYKVPEGDSRFSNRKLGNREYVAKLLQEIANQ